MSVFYSGLGIIWVEEYFKNFCRSGCKFSKKWLSPEKLQTNDFILMSNAKLKATLRSRRSNMELGGTHVVTCIHKIKTVSVFIVWY